MGGNNGKVYSVRFMKTAHSQSKLDWLILELAWYRKKLAKSNVKLYYYASSWLSWKRKKRVKKTVMLISVFPLKSQLG